MPIETLQKQSESSTGAQRFVSIGDNELAIKQPTKSAQNFRG